LRKFKILFLFFSFFLFSEEKSIKWEVGKNIEDFVEYENNVEQKRINNKPAYYSLRQSTIGVNEDVDLYLSFDSKVEKDLTGNYKVLYSKFLLSDNIYLNNNSAYFLSNEDRIELIGNNSSFFQPGARLGSFSISFWIYPVSNSINETILSIGGHYYNKKENKTEEQAIICKLENGKVLWDFLNVFSLNEKVFSNIKIDSVTRIIPERWSLINLTYNSYNGIIKLYINGNEAGIGIATIDGNLHSSVLNMSYHPTNRCFIKIAQSFIGAVDEFYIFKKDIMTSEEKYSSNGGEIISKVIDIGKGGGIIKKVNIEDFKDNNSEIFYFYRYSDKPFYSYYEYSQNIKWMPFNKESIIPDKIRFIQWRILLLPGNNNNNSPKFRSLEIIYYKDIPPARPVGLKAIVKGNTVILKWIRNSEKDIMGYKIYYGTRSNYYFGKDATNGESPIIIDANEDFDKHGIPITGLKNNVMYYFAVTAFDDEEKTNESDFSDEIVVRTMGSEY